MANCNLSRIYLDRGGYELGNGTYWGHGQPLYRYTFDNGVTSRTGTLRASSRDDAKAKVKSFCITDWPSESIVFYR